MQRQLIQSIKECYFDALIYLKIIIKDNELQFHKLRNIRINPFN